MELLSASNI